MKRGVESQTAVLVCMARELSPISAHRSLRFPDPAALPLLAPPT